MAMTLDSVTEERIQRQLSRGVYSEPAELLAHALDLVEDEDDWLYRNREAIHADLEECFAQAARGEMYTLDEVKAKLAARRLEHAA